VEDEDEMTIGKGGFAGGVEYLEVNVMMGVERESGKVYGWGSPGWTRDDAVGTR
jgi:hypothetical protein